MAYSPDPALQQGNSDTCQRSRLMISKTRTLLVITALTSVLAVVWRLSLPVVGRPVGHVVYAVSLRQDSTDVQVSLSGVVNDERTLELVFPRWRPGSYMIKDHTNSIYNLTALDVDGVSLPISSEGTCHWTVHLAKKKGMNVTVSYRIASDALSQRTRHVDETHAFLSGASTFLYSPTWEDNCITVLVSAPPKWSVATPLRQLKQTNAYYANSYADLAESFLEVGLHSRSTLSIDGTTYEIVIWPRDQLVSHELFSDFGRSAHACSELFGPADPGRFTLVIHAKSGLLGGTEFLRGALVQVEPRHLLSPTYEQSERKPALEIAIHELIHEWNIKGCIPAELVPYDLTQEQECGLLWFVEGGATYLSLLILTRSGIYDTDQWLNIIQGVLSQEDHANTRLDAASRRIWSGDTRYFDHVYGGGFLAVLAMDLRIRAQTDGRASIGKVLHQLQVDYARGSDGYSLHDISRIMMEITGTDPGAFLDDVVANRALFAIPDLLVTVGLELTRIDVSTTSAENQSSTDARPSSTWTLRRFPVPSNVQLSALKAWVNEAH